MKRILLVVCLVVSGVSSAWAQGLSPDVIERGWRPAVELAGQGDADLAVTRLRDYIHLQQLVMDHTEYHPETQAFIDELWDSLEGFDLDGFYQLLPEREAQWHRLRVYGRSDDSAYLIGPEPPADGRLAASPALGDFSATIGARQIETPDATHYLLKGDIDLGLGEITWPSVVSATQEALRLMAEDDPGFSASSAVPAQRFKTMARAMNPGLTPEEVNIVAPLWAAFPEIWNLLASLGKIEHLLVAAPAQQPYRTVRASFVLDPAMVQHGYPELAGYLRQLDNLMQLQLRVYDEFGQLVRVNFDTETLRAEVSMVVKDGQILPVRHEQPVLNAPAFDPDQRKQLTVRINSQMNILGIIARVRGMSADITYTPTEQGARFDSRTAIVPGVRVGGRALGMVPPDLLELFLPRDIDELIVDFLTVACEGNDGQGITGSLAVNSDAGETSRLTVNGAFEGLDNFLVRIGMGIINHRIIPDAEVSEDIRQLVADAHEAFSSDLDQFDRTRLAQQAR